MCETAARYPLFKIGSREAKYNRDKQGYWRNLKSLVPIAKANIKQSQNPSKFNIEPHISTYVPVLTT